jgi:predicted dehydrogenase
MKSPIKLGLIRCDTHAYHFMAMLQKCDPQLLKKNDRITWHYFSDIFTDELTKMPRVGGFELVKLWDEDAERARIFSETFLNAPKVCGTLAEMTEGIDAVFVSDCMGDGKDHLKLGAPFLKKGIPMFMDKPLAFSLADARQLAQLAKRHKTPFFSASSLSFVPTADLFKARFPEIGKVGLGIVKNCGCALSQDNLGGRGCNFVTEEQTWPYVVHGIALALHIFGYGVEWVRCMGSLPWEYLLLHLANGREALVINTSFALFSESFDLYAHAYSNLGVLNCPAIGDPQYIPGAARILQHFKKMILTGRTPLSYEQMLEVMEIKEAGRVAQRTGKQVYLKDIRKKK